MSHDPPPSTGGSGGDGMGWSTPAYFGSEGLQVKNTPGSTAGAGSGEFHQYRYLRRKEFFRLKQMDIEAKKQEETKKYKEMREQKDAKASAKTAKKSSKRKKLKQKHQEAKSRKKNETTGEENSEKKAKEEEEGEEEEGESGDSEPDIGPKPTIEESSNKSSEQET